MPDQNRSIIFLIGPMAVGKMTVAQELQKKLNYDVFHNHQSIEFALPYFDYDTAGFQIINEGIRQLIFQTIATDQQKLGFIFTYVWDFDRPEDSVYIEQIDRLFVEHGWTSYYIELHAPQAIRLIRNRTANRLRHKPSKADLQRSEEILLNIEQESRLTSRNGELHMTNYLKLENSNITAETAADRIIKQFHLQPLV